MTDEYPDEENGMDVLLKLKETRMNDEQTSADSEIFYKMLNSP